MLFIVIVFMGFFTFQSTFRTFCSCFFLHVFLTYFHFSPFHFPCFHLLNHVFTIFSIFFHPCYHCSSLFLIVHLLVFVHLLFIFIHLCSPHHLVTLSPYHVFDLFMFSPLPMASSPYLFHFIILSSYHPIILSP